MERCGLKGENLVAAAERSSFMGPFTLCDITRPAAGFDVPIPLCFDCLLSG